MKDQATTNNNIGKYAGIMWRKQVIANLEAEQERNYNPSNPHDKMMADARKRVLKKMKAVDAKSDVIQKATATDIKAVAMRYNKSVMDDGYINVYGSKAVCLL